MPHSLAPPEMGRGGIEHYSNFLGNTQISKAGGAKSGAVAGGIESELALLVDAWPGLPADRRAAILSIVRGWVHDGE